MAKGHSGSTTRQQSKDRRRKTVTLELWSGTVQQLDDLVDVLGTTREQVVEAAIHQQFAARHKLLTGECPWVLTEPALEQAMQIA